MQNQEHGAELTNLSVIMSWTWIITLFGVMSIGDFVSRLFQIESIWIYVGWIGLASWNFWKSKTLFQRFIVLRPTRSIDKFWWLVIFVQFMVAVQAILYKFLAWSGTPDDLALTIGSMAGMFIASWHTTRYLNALIIYLKHLFLSK